MKRMNAIDAYVWAMFGCGLGWVFGGEPIAAAVAWAGAGIVLAIGEIAKKYEDRL